MIHLLILFALYFLPALIAGQRHAHNRTAITLLNLFFGWTGIGWILALLWALTSTPEYLMYPPPQYPPYYR